MDIAKAIEALLPDAKWGGAFDKNTKKEYDDLRWEDERDKPSWNAIKAADDQLANKPDLELIAQTLLSEFSQIDEDLQADLSPWKAAVKLELEQGNLNIVKKIIERQQVPQEAEIIKQKLLDIVNSLLGES